MTETTSMQLVRNAIQEKLAAQDALEYAKGYIKLLEELLKKHGLDPRMVEVHQIPAITEDLRKVVLQPGTYKVMIERWGWAVYAAPSPELAACAHASERAAQLKKRSGTVIRVWVWGSGKDETWVIKVKERKHTVSPKDAPLFEVVVKCP